jgi:hypothetical protein
MSSDENNKQDDDNGDSSGFSIRVGNITGDGTVIGKNVNIGSVNINKQHLSGMPPEYAKGLEDFSKLLNQELKNNGVPEEKSKPIQESVDELAKETQDVKAGADVPYIKKVTVEAKLANVVQQVLNVLPQAAQDAALFTPLAPFGKLIGKGIGSLIQMMRK